MYGSVEFFKIKSLESIIKTSIIYSTSMCLLLTWQSTLCGRSTDVAGFAYVAAYVENYLIIISKKN